MRTVIHRQLVESAGLLGPLVRLRFVAANEPENGWSMPLGPEAAEVFARRRGTGVMHAILGEVRSESFGDPVARRLVVQVERIPVERRDLWLSGRARRLGLSISDPLDCGEHALADARIERPDVQLYDGVVWDDVLFCARVQDAHRNDGGFSGGHFPRDDSLKPQDRRGRHDDRVDAGLRHRAMGAPSEQIVFADCPQRR